MNSIQKIQNRNYQIALLAKYIDCISYIYTQMHRFVCISHDIKRTSHCGLLSKV